MRAYKIKNHPLLSFMLVLFIVFGGYAGWFLFGNRILLAFKETDPSHSAFDPMKFKFGDYSDVRLERAAISRMFPLGSDRQYIREIMGSSNVTQTTWNANGRLDIDIYGYECRDYPCTGNIRGYVFSFDSSNKLIRVACSVNDNCILLQKEE